MPDSRTAPTRDETFRQYSPVLHRGKARCRTVPSIRNGYFQHIFWLGVNGWVVVDHYDAEILLVDPWPTYRKPGERHERRMEDLVAFLRASIREGYHVTGILITHAHFDHTDDVPRILDDLLDDPGKGHLPAIHADRDSIERLKDRMSSRIRDEAVFQEIVDPERGSLRYDEFTNRKKGGGAQPAGVRAASFSVGSFDVEPWVWDHYSMLPFKAVLGPVVGNLQRQTAFLIRHGSAGEAKATFIIGSAGEMSHRYAGPVDNIYPPMQVDLLIQSICPKRNLSHHLEDLVSYQKRCLDVRDFIVCSHWERFLGVQGGAASRKEFRKDFRKVRDYIGVLEEPGLKKRVFILGRRGFEYPMPRSASDLRLDARDPS